MRKSYPKGIYLPLSTILCYISLLEQELAVLAIVNYESDHSLFPVATDLIKDQWHSVATFNESQLKCCDLKPAYATIVRFAGCSASEANADEQRDINQSHEQFLSFKSCQKPGVLHYLLFTLVRLTRSP